MTHDIKFENWYILPPPPVVARQYDNLSRTLNVVGDLPDGYTWDMLVLCGGNMDIIRLSPTETGVGVTLTAQQLALAGDYSMQLRGTLGDVVQHTNVITLVIPESISGASQWPEIPSEFTQLEQRISEIASHPPIPGDDGFWEIWNPETDEYEPSEFPLPSGSGGGFPYKLGETLTVVGVNTLEVNTTDTVEQDNTLPITSAAVHTTVGNIEVMLKTI